MLARVAVKVLLKNVKQATQLIKYRQILYQEFTLMPKYSFFFNGKQKNEINKKKEEIQELYNQMHGFQNEHEQMDILKQVIDLREEMGKLQSKKCIYLLLDKIEYAKYLIDIQQIDHRIVTEVLDEEFLSNIHYENVELNKFPSNFEDYLKQSVIQGVTQLKILKLYDQAEDDQMRGWLDQFHTSILYTRNYLMLFYDEIGESEGYEVKEQVQASYQCSLVFYHEMLGRFLIDSECVQDSIETFEIAISENQRYLEIVSELSENENGDIANEATQLKEKAIGKFAALFQELGQIQMELKNYESARPYFEKAVEILLEVCGKHSMEYANSYCSLATTYRFSDMTKCEEMLKEYYEYLDSFEQDIISLEVGMEYFCVLESQQKGNQELFEKIYQLKEKCDTANVDLVLDYNILAIQYMVRNKTYLERVQLFYSEAFSVIDTISCPRTRAEKLLILLNLAYKFVEPNNSFHDSILELIYDELQDEEFQQVNETLQYQIDRAKAFLQFRLKDCLIIIPEESLQQFISFFSLWIEFPQYQDQLFIDVDEMIELIIDEKMLTLAYKTIKDMLRIMKEDIIVRHPSANERLQEAIEHYESQATQLQLEIIGKQ